MRCYVVGGAVRDELLGLPVRDHDWVVVGATPQEMLDAGFRPVGKDFPVFLHPDTHEEYALARTERKTAPGYKGFSFHAAPDVTLEEDLRRRDLTINAMARDDTGQIVDPYNGQQDLAARILRHVSPAFSEDPLRVLRVARFAARYGEFSIAPETLELMREIVTAGEIEHLVAERTWQELARGLSEKHPLRMLDVLRACGALERLLPELEGMDSAAVAQAATQDATLEVRWACLLHHLDANTVRAVSERIKSPNDVRDLAVLLARENVALHTAQTPENRLDLLMRCDALRRPQRFHNLLAAAACCGLSNPVQQDWRTALDAAHVPDGGAIATACANKADIPHRIRAARIDAIASAAARTPR